jgi:hypothetical protein
MTFTPMKTDDLTLSKTKTLIYANAGWGKTKQAAYYQAAFGPGFVISGESGLITLAKDKIDYLPFTKLGRRERGTWPGLQEHRQADAGRRLQGHELQVGHGGQPDRAGRPVLQAPSRQGLQK